MPRLVTWTVVVACLAVAACDRQGSAVTIGVTLGGDGVCTDAGGTVVTQQCCKSASEFPNTCLVGACGCSADNSAPLKVCGCPAGQCFDGKACVSLDPATVCTTAGGTVVTEQCCLSAPDFPNTCLIGACGCAAGNSAPRSVCWCPANTCWDGKTCVSR